MIGRFEEPILANGHMESGKCYKSTSKNHASADNEISK